MNLQYNISKKLDRISDNLAGAFSDIKDLFNKIAGNNGLNISLRDRIAIHAMGEIIGCNSSRSKAADRVASDAYAYADSMIAKRGGR